MNKQLILNQDYSLIIEREGKIARLVVVKNSIEFVCRKEKISVLQIFLKQSNAHIFKGRLQLDKHQTEINVIVKGEVVGTAYVEEVEALLIE